MSDADEMLAFVKAYVVGTDVSPAAAPSDYDLTQAFSLAHALTPPVDPRQLATIYRLSSLLRPCVEAVATNVDSFSHRLEPIIDLDKRDAREIVREALIEDRLAQGNTTQPTDQDIDAATDEIKEGQLHERLAVQRFFSYACPTKSFVALRMQRSIEEEAVGNAYWEVTRDADGKPVYFDRIEAHSMRLRRIDREYVQVSQRQRRSPLSYEERTVPRRFRSYVQVSLGMPTVYFKEYGDPRTWSSHTGRLYDSPEDLAAHEGYDAQPATEIVHWASLDLLGPYGLPPWYGAQFAVLGSLYSERVNHDLFDNKCIPPLAIFVNGGKLGPDARQKIQDHIETNIKGQHNWHKILILECEGSAANGGARVKIELHPLMSAQQTDQLFQEYEKDNFDKVKRQWRLPDLLVGKSQEVNRAQASQALKMVEQQVIQPRREIFDEWINRFLFPELGIRYWRYVSNSAITKDPELQTSISTDWVKAGVLTPNEGRELAGEVFNKDFPEIEDDWGNVPQPLMLAGIVPGRKADGAPVAPEVGAADLASRMIALRDSLRSQSETGAAVADMQKRMREATTVVKVPKETWDKWFEKDAG